MFYYLCKVLFSGFLQFNSNFGDAQNNLKYRDWAPLGYVKGAAHERVVLSGQTINKCIEEQAFWRRVGPSLYEIIIRLFLLSQAGEERLVGREKFPKSQYGSV